MRSLRRPDRVRVLPWSVTALAAIWCPAVAAAQTTSTVSFATNAVTGLQGPARQKAPKEPKAQKEKKKGGIEFRWQDHPEIRVGKKALQIDFRARVQEDVRRSDAPFDKHALDTLDIAKRRVGFEGDIYNVVQFEVSRDLVSTKDPWPSAYLNYHQFKEAEFQYGKIKLPFSLDENAGSTNLDFVYRSNSASQLAPGRGRGWMAHGHVLNHAIAYEFGQFEHDGSNAAPSASNPDRVTGGTTTAWRVTSEPFRSSKSTLADLEVGIASTASTLLEGFSTLNGKTMLGYTFFASDQIVNGQRKRTGFEMRWRPGPASIKAEYIKLTEQRLGESVENLDLSPRLLKGWYISGTYALTGGNKSKGLDQPEHPFLQGGAGTVEAAVRVERFSTGSVQAGPGSRSPRADIIASNADSILTMGVNWYANRWVKIQANLVRETLADSSRGPLPGQASFWSKLFRLQFQI